MAVKLTARQPVDRASGAIMAMAVAFFGATTAVSWMRWANFEYRTFDLAYYVQALWQLIHGRFQVSVEDVPLLGNHVEPIVFLFAPLFALFRHPMLFVVVQNAALATMGPIAYRIARRLGFAKTASVLLGGAVLLAPGTAYVALHEFHPEALTAPLLLAMFHARLAGRLVRHWAWFLAALACKENMALLLVAYCAVYGLWERKRGFAELRSWYLWPMATAVVWIILCARVITPAFNSGNIDYGELYNRLGNSPAQILLHAFTQPNIIFHALTGAISQGNLVWGLLLPFLCLPILKPRWLLIASPILLQHLLSWRSSEWTIYFHYAAPLLPIFWIAAVESVAALGSRQRASAFSRYFPPAIVAACFIGQFVLGPIPAMAMNVSEWSHHAAERARKNAFIAHIPPDASVLAPLPYLSHLAMRENLYSLHYVLKGLKTLSRSAYQPPTPTDCVLIDYLDSATFDAFPGYYHPAMRTADGRVMRSSDRLLHDFLSRAAWISESRDELTLLQKSPPLPSSDPKDGTDVVALAPKVKLLSLTMGSRLLSKKAPLEINIAWSFDEDREVFPWLELVFKRPGDGSQVVVTKGLCSPERNAGAQEETWFVTAAPGLSEGDYSLEARFFDNPRRAWSYPGKENRPSLLGLPISLGSVTVSRNSSPR